MSTAREMRIGDGMDTIPFRVRVDVRLARLLHERTPQEIRDILAAGVGRPGLARVNKRGRAKGSVPWNKSTAQ